jgi:signal transduction histidine kinase
MRVYNWLRAAPEGEDMATEAPSESQATAQPSLLRRAVRGVDPHLWDSALAFVLCAAGFVYVLAAPNVSPGLHGLDAVGAVLLLAMTLPLVAVRSHPRAVFVTIGVASVLAAVFAEPALNVGYWCGAIALFFVASRSDIRRSLMTGMTASVVLIVIFAILWYEGGVSIWIAAASWFGFSVIWLAGVLLHAYRENVREARERARAERERADLYLHDLEMRAQEAVALERSRLARELHDVVGHALNVVVLQAGAAQRVFDKKPETVRESLGSIEATGRQALGDIERLLGILRAEAGDREELGPQPGLTDIDGLVAQVREAGVAVAVDDRCVSVDLPSSLDRSGYRIVQEALTNTLKHAGVGARASVRLSCNGDWFVIECTDDGGGQPATGQFNQRLSGGRGLLGMRERVALFGGELEVGPRPEGGFRVLARLPLEGTGTLQQGVGPPGGVDGMGGLDGG